jgi:excisionase family DNA binding protein
MIKQQQNQPFKPPLTIMEAAAYAKVGRRRIDAAIAMGELRYVSLGPGTRRILITDLEKWLESKTTKGIQQ